MGLSIKCKKTGTGYLLGYFGMFRLRSKVAELFDREFMELYDDTAQASSRLKPWVELSAKKFA